MVRNLSILKCLLKSLKCLPNITSIKQNINDSHSNVIMGRHSVTLYGKEKIVDQLSEVTFNISDQSFYQINSAQTEKLYQKQSITRS